MFEKHESTMLKHLNYTVILTYMNLLFGVMGILMASHQVVVLPVVCLGLAGICDAFDGQVARMKKGRTEKDKAFGIQIDSLADIVSFGVLPVFIAYNQSATYNIFVVGAIYILAGVTRLGYYNVLESENLYKKNNPNEFFVGLPITSVCVIMPFLCMVPFESESMEMFWACSSFLVLMALFFVAPIKIPKPNKKLIIILSIIGGIGAGLLIYFMGIQL